MPFRSKRQWGWAFATGQPFARRWAHETPGGKGTRYRTLPAAKDAGAVAGAMLSGPGGLMATPGLGARPGRKWGKRTKAKRIVGNLYRGNDGKFQAGGSGDASASAPTATGDPTQGSAARRPGDLAGAAEGTARQAGRAETLQDAIGGTARQATGGNKPKKGGGGGGKGKKPKQTPAERRAARAQERAQLADATGAQLGLAAADVAALRQAAEAGGAKSAALAKLGLIDAKGDATDAGRRALSALERGDVRGYRAAVQDAADRAGRAQARAGRDAERAKRSAERETARAKRETERQTRQAESDRRRQARERRQARRDRIAAARAETAAQRVPGRAKSLMVYKAADGTPRWLARSTTAYRDRDGEILSEAALDADSRRMTTTKAFGPLRWWHVGRPDPTNAAAPWGPGLDLGDCDFSMVIGRTRVEGGTFKSAQVARAVARVAGVLELSPGFFHPPDAPDAHGVFGAIHTFERSLVPTRYAQASNLFTGLMVKETRAMHTDEIERRFKAAIHELQLTPDQALQLGRQLVETEKAAAQQGIAFKSADAPAVYTGPDGTPGIIQDGRWVALKAATPPPAPPVAEAEKAPGDEAAEDPADEGSPEDMAQDEGDFLGDMSVADFEAMLGTAFAQAIAPLIKSLDVAGKLAGHVEELKGMMGGYATKEASSAAEIATLKARLAALEGDAPADALALEALAALKSAGPGAPPAPSTKPAPDGANPLAAMAAGLFPELYPAAGR